MKAKDDMTDGLVIVALIFAAIAFARVGIEHPGPTIAGYACGLLVGWLFARHYGPKLDRWRERRESGT